MPIFLDQGSILFNKFTTTILIVFVKIDIVVGTIEIVTTTSLVFCCYV